MATLYRKYRPQSFKDLIGQKHIKITLEHEIELGQIGHAYLFTGPRGLGKTSTARLFAKAVNCLDRKEGESEPCNKCNSCEAIVSNSAVDVIEIDAASNTQVDKVRENIIESVRFAPSSAKYKVFIIDEVHMLSTSAFNALLKTLEEPPAHAIFILCTTEIHKVPQTIISRCQRFDFKKVSKEELMKRLNTIVEAESKKVDDKVLENIVVYSESCIRDAESLLGKILTLGDDITMEQAEIVLPRSDFDLIAGFINYLLDNNSTAAIELINKLVDDGVDLQIFTDNLIEFLRKVILVKISGDLTKFGVELDESAEKEMKKISERFDYSKLMLTIDVFLTKRQDLKTAFISQFPLEMAVVEIIRGSDKNEDNDHHSGGTSTSIGAENDFVRQDSVASKEKIEKKEEAEPIKVDTVYADAQKKQKDKDEIKIDMLSKSNKVKQKCKVDFKKVVEKWPGIVRSLLEENYTLSSLLRISQPLKCEGNELEIGVKSNFYKSRLEVMKNKEIIEKVISEAISAEVQIRGEVKSDIEPIDVDVSDLLATNDSSEEENTTQQSSPTPTSQSKPVTKIEKSKDVVSDVIGMF